MKILALSLFLTSLISSLSQLVNPPELKLAFDSDQFDLFKMNVLAQLVLQKAQNLSLPDIPINLTSPVPINGVLNNVTIVNLTLDWNNTHILSPDLDDNFLNIQISNLSTFIDFSATIDTIKSEDNSMTINGLDLLLKLGFTDLKIGTAYAYIESVNLTIQEIKPYFKADFAEIIVRALGDRLEPIVTKQLTKAILASNETLINMTTNGIRLGILDRLLLNVSLATPPRVENLDGKAYQLFAINFALEDNITHEVAPVESIDSLPDLIVGELPFQLIMSDVMISQILWAALDSGKVNITISKANEPPQIPVELYTSDLIILFPNIVNDFPPDKGVYLNIQKGGDFPIAGIRDGRLVLDISLNLDVYIDLDSSQYPDQGLANCTNCTLGYQLNLTAFVAAVFSSINFTTVDVSVMNVFLNEVQKISGDIDPLVFQNNLNELLTPLLAQINEQLKGGMTIPDIELLMDAGLNDTSLVLGPNYLFAGIQLIPGPLPPPNSTLDIGYTDSIIC